MAWTAPMTAVSNAIFTAAQFNTHVRDNLLETAPAKAATVSGYFVTTGTNSISERSFANNTVATSQTTASTTYADLATVGPAVTVSTTTKAMVFLKSDIFNATATNGAFMGFAVSGASTIAAADTSAISAINSGAAAGNAFGASFLVTTLTAGSNTFTAKYRSTAATNATFANRDIIVMPL